MMKLLLLSVCFTVTACLGAPEQPSPAPVPLTPQGRAAILVPPTREALEASGDDRNSQVCGIRRTSVPDIFTRIVGGSPAEQHEFPWQVSLQWRYNWYTYHVCGATVINHSWVLTAAHCIHQFQPKDVLVVAGDHQLKHKEGAEQSRYVERIIEHPMYNSNTQENDIALLKLTAPLALDGVTVSPICLPPYMTQFSGNCVVTGWGNTKEEGASSDLLRKVVVPIISDEECLNSYRAIGYTGPIASNMVCAGYGSGAKDACQGDSGGPFVCKGPDNRYYMAGVVSWGIGCARPNVPGVYTETSHFVTWISNVLNNRVAVEPRPISLRVGTFEEARASVTSPQHSSETEEETEGEEAEDEEAQKEKEAASQLVTTDSSQLE